MLFTLTFWFRVVSSTASPHHQKEAAELVGGSD